jgi:hypothetical protein
MVLLYGWSLSFIQWLCRVNLERLTNELEFSQTDSDRLVVAILEDHLIAESKGLPPDVKVVTKHFTFKSFNFERITAPGEELLTDNQLDWTSERRIGILFCSQSREFGVNFVDGMKFTFDRNRLGATHDWWSHQEITRLLSSNEKEERFDVINNN